MKKKERMRIPVAPAGIFHRAPPTVGGAIVSRGKARRATAAQSRISVAPCRFVELVYNHNHIGESQRAPAALSAAHRHRRC